MRVALKGKPEIPLKVPPGIVSIRIDSKTGKPTHASNPDAMFEYFLTEQAKAIAPPSSQSDTTENPTNGGDITQEIF